MFTKTMKGHHKSTSSPATFEDHFDSDKMEAMDARIKKRENREKSMQDTRETAKRSLRTLADTERLGAATAEELERQGQQIDSTIEKMDTLEQHMNATDRLMRNGKHPWSGLQLLYYR